MKLNELEKGRQEALRLLVRNVELKTTKTGKPYCRITVTDGETDMEGNFWGADTLDQCNSVIAKYKGKIADVVIENADFITIKRLRLSESQDLTSFIKTAPVPSEQMYDEIIDRVNKISMPAKQIALLLYEHNKDALLKSCGGLKLHHSVYGGLLYHVYRMMLSADKICDVYQECNRDLLVLGVILHDIGKLQELDTSDIGVAEFTTDGTLMGHVLMGVIMVREAAMEINHAAENDTDGYEQIPDEQIRILEHMIAAHHGEKEFGAIVTPAFLEAFLLSQLDMLDSRAYIYTEENAKIAPGTISESIYRLGGSHLYCMQNLDENEQS